MDIGSLSSNQIAAYRKDMERSQGLWNAYYSGMTPEVKRAASETVMGLESIQRPSVPVNGTQEPSINSNFGTSPTATSTVPFSDSEYSNIADTPLSDFSISQNAGRSKSSQATAASMDRDTFNRIYEATGKNIPTTVKVNGMDIPSSSFMDSVDSMLPDSIEDLTFISDQARELENADLLEDQLRAIGKINERMETQISPQMLGYGSEKSGPLKINIQLFASSVKRKLEWLELSSRPEGPHIGDFLKRHMQGIDDNSELGRILKENAVGTPARPDSVVADEAAELISTEAKRNSLYNKIMNLEEGQALSDKEVVAAKRMIREFTESGDYDKAVNLIRGADRSGTESGRALRQFGNTLATDPEGVLRRASRSMREGFDAAHFAGAADQVDDFISRFSRRVQKATEGRSITSDDILRALDDSISSASSKQIGKLIGKNKKALAERIYEAVNNGALDNDDLRHAFYNALNFPQLSSETARRLVELSKKAEGLADYSKEQAQVFEEIYQTIADEIPMSALEKWQSWRKFAMLSNPKTHLKNMASNAAMRGVRKVTDTLSAWLEKVFIRDPSKRTKSLFWKGSEHGKRILPQVNEAAERAVMEMGNVGKFDISDSAILKHRKMFKDKGLRKGVNFASSLNSKLLEGEDVLSFRPIFRDTLGQYMTARGLTDVTDEAYKYAFDASLEAVFRADNALNDAISSLKRSNHKITREIVDMVVPFSKTPSNLIVQAVEYSPVGLAKSGVDLVLSLSGKSGKEAAEIINEFSKGLVGTGLSVLGFYLGRSGLINTKYSQGKKQQAAADVDGELENSIDFFGTNVSIDWIQPAAFPLIFGAVIGQSSADGDTDVAGAILDGADSIFELSMLQSISELFNSESISEGLSTVPANAISQSIPTVMGQIARSVDPIQRRVKGDSFLETSFNTVTSKIPWATTLLEPRTDLWGNEVRRNKTENPALNAFNQLINPFSVKSATYQDDPVTQMLLQIYKDSKDSNALPSFPTDTVEHPLSLKEYTQYAQTVGDAQRDAVEELLREIQSKNPRYKFSKKTEQNGKEKTVTYKKHWDEMTADEKAKILDRVFSEAKTDAEDELDKFVKGAFQ